MPLVQVTMLTGRTADQIVAARRAPRRRPAGNSRRPGGLDIGPGERRIIQSVDLWYSKDRWTKRPKVSLYGLR